MDGTGLSEDYDERLYRWTVRGLYAGAILLNCWVLWDQVKDTPEVQIAKAQVNLLARRIWSPIHTRRRFRRHANAVIYEATEIVEAS